MSVHAIQHAESHVFIPFFYILEGQVMPVYEESALLPITQWRRHMQHLRFSIACLVFTLLFTAGCEKVSDFSASNNPEIQPPFDQADYYVATDGDDNNNGTIDQPFATLERARQAVREYKANEAIPENGLVVAVRGGVYQRNDTFTLTAEDSGEQSRPVWWGAYPGETVRITGAAHLESGWFGPVNAQDPNWGRLDTAVRSQIQVIDLSAHGITDYGILMRRGYSARYNHSALEFFVNGIPMELARWPNRDHTDAVDLTADANVSGDIFGTSTMFTYMGDSASGNADDGYANYTANVNGQDYYLYHCTWEWEGNTNRSWFLSTHNPVTDTKCWPANDISWLANGGESIPPLSPLGVGAIENVTVQNRPVDFAQNGFLRTIDGISNTTFTFPGVRYQRWSQASDIWFHGRFDNLWADDTIRGTINPGSGIVTLDESASQNVVQFRPFFVMNLIEEIDIPGEWWLDRTTGRLYYYPVTSLDSSDLAVSMLEKTLLEMKNAAHIRFVDLVFDHTRGNMISAKDVNDVIFKGSTFRGSGADAVQIAGTASGLEHCVVADSGGYGVYLDGGDRPTLMKGNLFVRNTELARFGRWDRSSKPGVRLEGCGNVVEHNYFHDTPHSAIMFGGNDHRIEYNDIERAVLEASDTGAIYSGRDWGYRGNLIRYNFIHDIGNVLGGARGVYMDDVVSGNTIIGNIITNVQGFGTQTGGGRDNRFENNIIMDTTAAAHATDRRANLFVNYEFDNSGRPGSWNLLGRLNWDYQKWSYGQPRIAYQDAPWALRYPELAAIPNDWSQVQAGTWRDPEGCTFANNIVWRSGGLIYVGTYGGNNATDFYQVIAPNLEVDPLFVDEAGGNMNLLPGSPAFHTPGFNFTPIPFDQIGILP